MRLSDLLAACVILGIVACATVPTIYPEHPLVDEILKVRKGHEGLLTNRTCALKTDPNAADSSPGCQVEHIKDYALSDPEFRQTVNRLNFICNVGGKRYKICLDKPGFCRFSYTQDCFLGFICKPAERLEEYLPVEKYGFLLDANVRCAKKEKYDLWSNH